MTQKKQMNSKKSNNKQAKKNNILKISSILILSIALLTIIVPKLGKDDRAETVTNTETTTTGTTTTQASNEAASTSITSVDDKGNIVIPVADVTEKASFYAYNELGNDMEVIAVKASDGTIRTAFNTCQVCNGSGRGYYEENNGILTCQNCGNQFGMDDVGAIRGGCNPVPISDEEKEVTDTSIVISKAVLEENEGIFENWKY